MILKEPYQCSDITMEIKTCLGWQLYVSEWNPNIPSSFDNMLYILYGNDWFLSSDARNAILEYSESAAELLSRKKMRRDMLFQYLSQQKQHVAVNMDKCALVDAVLRFWGSQPLRKTQFFEVLSDLLLIYATFGINASFCFLCGQS